MTLQWKRLTDMRKASDCGRYVIDREPHYDNYPRMDYRYVAKRADMQANPMGEFESFEQAECACERDLINQIVNQKGE